ncbi:hypothetical protein [Streptomyces uncialis]|uniref:Uncharacterized protein n=1 Tax=Streptomyces uncialis TaxID=1048205 RepID=A0A1Q4V9D2_9ACTN|nr:hypothetical protein [Streptomyces uncialis]OKH94446.1 hypothetical protein AB852_09115 [Streptomyces uncialis]
MSSADPDGGPGSAHVSSRGVGSSSFGSVGDHATFRWELKRPLTHVAWLPVSIFLVIAVTVGFAFFAVIEWPGGPRGQYVWFYAFTALALLFAGAAALSSDRGGQAGDVVRPGAGTRRRRTARALLVGAAMFCCGGGALAWVDVDRTGEVGAEMTVRGTQPVDEKGGILTVEMARPAAGDVRDKLRLTLIIIDDDPRTPTCVGRTTATITAVTSGVTPHTEELAAESTVDFHLGGGQGAVRWVVEVRPEKGCSMRLAQAGGTLHNH